MARWFVQHRLEVFQRNPLSVRNAMAVIVAATLVSVMVGGALITVVDRRSSRTSVRGCGGRCRR